MAALTGSLKSRIGELEKKEIVNALRESGWVMARAARRLGISERMIGYRVKKYGLRIKEVRWIDHEGKAPVVRGRHETEDQP